MSKIRVKETTEREFSQNEIVASYLIIKNHLTDIKSNQTELNDLYKTTLLYFSDEALKGFSDHFVIDREKKVIVSHNSNWERFEKYFEAILTNEIKDEYLKLSDEKKESYLLSQIERGNRLIVLKYLATLALQDENLTSWKIKNLYTLSSLLGIKKEEAVKVMKDASNSEDKMLKMISGLDQYSQIYSYLYSIRAFLHSGQTINPSEIKALKALRKQFKLDFEAGEFWHEFLHMMEGNRENLCFIDEKHEVLPIIAALNLIANEDDDFSDTEKAFIVGFIKKFSVKKADISGLKEYSGKELKDILSLISPKGKVYLAIEALSLVCADGKFNDKEAKSILSIIQDLIKNNVKLKGAHSLYLLFINLLLNNPGLCQYKDGEFIKQFDGLLKSILGYNRDIKKVIFMLETYLNNKGQEFDKRTLSKVLTSLGESDYNADIFADELLSPNFQDEDRVNILLAFLKSEVMLEDKTLSKEFMVNLVDTLDAIKPPDTDVKNAIAYFTLRAILLDEEVEEDEISFYDDLVFNMGVDQSLIYKYVAYLFLETSIRYNFAGWLDYRTFLEERGISKSRFYVWQGDDNF